MCARVGKSFEGFKCQDCAEQKTETKAKLMVDLNGHQTVVSQFTRSNFGDELAGLPIRPLCTDHARIRRGRGEDDNVQIAQNWVPVEEAAEFLRKRKEPEVELIQPKAKPESMQLNTPEHRRRMKNWLAGSED